MSEHAQQPSSGGARWVIPPQAPPPRFGLRPGARWLRRSLKRLRGPGVGSQEWLEQHGLLLIGEHSYGKPHVHVFAGDSSRVEIGRWCSIAGDVEIMPGGNHRTDTVTTYPIQRRLHAAGTAPANMPLPDGDVVSRGDVVIGNDVWIGRGVRVLGGVTIGDGAVIAAYSVVTRSVEPYTIAAGVPARAVRSRFPAEIVAALLRIRWWDWDEELVFARAHELTSDDLAGFTRAYDPAPARQEPSSSP